MTGCWNDSQAPESFRFPDIFLRYFFTTRLIDSGALNPSPPVAF
jgi:hypothetical protein